MTRRSLIALMSLLGLAALAAWIRLGPLPPGLLDRSRFVSTVVTDRNGEVIYESPSPAGTRAGDLDPETLPENLVDATLAAEDRRFFRHPGVDVLAVARAAWRNLRAGRVVEGGSTITQQVVKLLSDSPPRTLAGKVREAILALRLEHRLDKNEILAMYLELAPYGGQFAGATRASHGYFGVPPSLLTPAQAALLAGLPQRPAAHDPFRNPEAAIRRQRHLIERMRVLGMLSAEEARSAQAEKLTFRRAGAALFAPHFVLRVLAENASRRPVRIETTLDQALQSEVTGILSAQRENLRAHGAANVAVVVLDNRAGEWLAWEGSGDYFDAAHGGAIDGATTPRQPGSALKPFTYALAFERDRTPASMLPDIPSHFPTGVSGVLYSPRNYDGVFRGPLRARAALAGSENVPAVALLAELGVADLQRLLRQLGISTLDRTADYYGLGLTLGNAEVRLDELVTAYATFARGGVTVRPRSIRRIDLTVGRSEAAETQSGAAVIAPRTAFWISDVLSDAEARAFAFGRGGSLEFPFPVAVKTGTSQAYHDNWTVAWTRSVTVGVWVGNFDRSPLRRSSGVTGAAPICHQVLLAAERRVTGRSPDEHFEAVADPTPELGRRPVCALTGMTPTAACVQQVGEWLPDSGVGAKCTWHALRDGESQVVWPAEYRAWAAERGMFASGAAPASPPESGANVVPLRITNPPAGAIYLHDPTLRRPYQSIAFRAVAADPRTRLEWFVDGKPVGRTRADEAFDWPLRVGEHEVTVRDSAGRTAGVEFVVR